MKNFVRWGRMAAVVQLLTAAVHSVTFFVCPFPLPANETERQFDALLTGYKMDLGLGIHRTFAQMYLAMSTCFTLLYLLGSLMLWHLATRSLITKGIANIYLFVFGTCFIITATLTFIPPTLFSGLSFLLLVFTRLNIPKYKT